MSLAFAGIGVKASVPSVFFSRCVASAKYVAVTGELQVVALAAGAFFVYSANQPAVAAAADPAKSLDRNAALLEAMKEEMFDLETERLQGKLSPQEYEAAKSALDKTLRRAMQRQAGPK